MSFLFEVVFGHSRISFLAYIFQNHAKNMYFAKKNEYAIKTTPFALLFDFASALRFGSR